jgi:hypothetical protein
VPPTGFFSQNTALPAAAVAFTTSVCSMLGAVTQTASTSGASTSSRQSATARSKPKLSVASRRRSGSVSAQATRLVRSPLSWKIEALRASDRLCAWPIHPKPITPVRISRGLVTPGPSRRRPGPTWSRNRDRRWLRVGQSLRRIGLRRLAGAQSA